MELARRNFLMIELVRTGQFIVVLGLAAFGFLFQPGFMNFEVLFSTYISLSLAFLMHFMIALKSESFYNKRVLLFISFVVDVLLVTALINKTNFGQSLYLFLFLIGILCSGLLLRTGGAYFVALVCSIAFSVVTLAQEGLRPFQLFLTLALHNVAFFTVAGLSSYFAEEFFLVEGELKAVGVSLRSQEELNRSIMENAPTGILLYSDKGRVLTYNHWFEKVFRISKEVQHLTDLFSPASVPKDFYSAREANFEFSLRIRNSVDPSLFRVRKTEFFDEKEQTQVHLGVIEDITDIRRLEENLRHKEKLAAVGGLAAGIAHEIRNPLAGISGSIELLSRETKNEDDKKLMNIILREINRLNNLISEFLEYSRPDKPPTEKVDLAILLQACLQNMQMNQNLRKDVEIVTHFESAVVLGHEDKLKQAFLNIIINSFQAMEKVERPKLRVEIHKLAQGYEVVVADTGCGMPEETKRRMFEPFHTTKPKGTGLGLAVTHKILDNHRVQLSVESEVGKGTIMRLIFPV